MLFVWEPNAFSFPPFLCIWIEVEYNEWKVKLLQPVPCCTQYRHIFIAKAQGALQIVLILIIPGKILSSAELLHPSKESKTRWLMT